MGFGMRAVLLHCSASKYKCIALVFRLDSPGLKSFIIRVTFFNGRECAEYPVGLHHKINLNLRAEAGKSLTSSSVLSELPVFALSTFKIFSSCCS